MLFCAFKSKLASLILQAVRQVIHVQICACTPKDLTGLLCGNSLQTMLLKEKRGCPKSDSVSHVQDK